MLRDGRARNATDAFLWRGDAAHELHVAINEGNSPRNYECASRSASLCRFSRMCGGGSCKTPAILYCKHRPSISLVECTNWDDFTMQYTSIKLLPDQTPFCGITFVRLQRDPHRLCRVSLEPAYCLIGHDQGLLKKAVDELSRALHRDLKRHG